MGIDFSTHGRIGVPVYAIDSGQIVRVKRSYYGYGNAIYLMTPDSCIYVYAHLDRFIKPIEDTVFKAQEGTRRYRQDIYFKDSVIHVKKGEVLGYSGESGVGYPHLHFEKRIGWLMPIFPLKEKIPLQPALDGVIMETPSGNYEVRHIKTKSVYLPFAKRFKLFFLARHVRKMQILQGKDTLFELSIDTLSYLKQRNEGLLYKPREGYFKGFIRTNFDSIRPYLVKKSTREYKLKKHGSMKLVLVSFYGDTAKYSLIFSKKVKRHHVFYRTYDGILYSFSDYGMYVNEKAKEKGYRFVRFDKDTLLIIGNSRIYTQINTRYLPYLKGIFYRVSGDSLFLYPEFPSMTGYVYLKSRDTTKQVYRLSRGGRKYVTRTLKLGAFVLEGDTTSPYVRYIGGTDSIAFYVDDDLSGVEPDSMSLYLNNRWYPVYYDFERKVAALHHTLPDARYTVVFRACDRAHNCITQRRKVYLK